jgi:mannose-6-phosphate isomerase-like protein (cupin superfamily)
MAKPVGPAFERHDDRGSFVEVVREGSWEAIIHGTMKPDSVMGNHYHTETRIFFFLIRGAARVTLEWPRSGKREVVEVKAGQGLFFEPFHAHAIRYTEESDFLLIKSRAHDPKHSDMVKHALDS